MPTFLRSLVCPPSWRFGAFLAFSLVAALAVVGPVAAETEASVPVARAAGPVFSELEPADGALVADREVVLRGRVDGAVRLIVDGRDVEIVDGRFEVGPVRLSEGPRAFVLVADDAAGVRTEQLHRVEADRRSPTLLWTRPRDGATVRTSPVRVEGSVAELHLAEMRIGGATIELDRTRFRSEIDLEPGPNVVRIVARDALGHETVEERTVVYDPGAPTVAVRVEVEGEGPADVAEAGASPAGPQIVGLLDEARFPRRVRLHVAVEDATPTEVEVLLDGRPYRLGPGGIGPWIGSGDHEVRVRVSDAGRNVTAVRNELTVDLGAPVLDRIGPSGERLLGAADVRVYGRVHDREGRVERVTVDGIEAELRLLSGHPRGGTSKFESPPLELADGQIEVVIEATDEVGHVARHVLRLERDATEPEVEVSELARRTSASELRLEGVVRDASAVEIRVAGEPVVEPPGASTGGFRSGGVGPAPDPAPARGAGPSDSPLASPVPGDGGTETPTASGSARSTTTELGASTTGSSASPGSRSFVSRSIPLEPGTNRIPIEARDAAGNVLRRTLLVERDVTGPTIAVTVGGVAMADGAQYAGPVAPAITAVDPEGGDVSVDATVDGVTFTSGETVSGDGEHELSVTATDDTGLSNAVTLAFSIDSVPPALGDLLPETGHLTSAPSITLTGTAIGASEVRVDGAAVELSGEGFAAVDLPLVAGDNAFAIEAEDALGRIASATHVIVRDSTPPTLSVAQPAPDALLGVGVVDVSGTAQDAHLVAVEVHGRVADRSGSAFLAAGITLNEGDNEIVVAAIDGAGNRTEVRRTVSVDREAPVVAVTDPAAGTVTPEATLTVRGTVADAHLDRVDVDGQRSTVVDGVWTAEVALEEGVQTVLVEAFDRLGHRSETSIEVSRDSTAPAIRIETPEDDLSVQAAEIEVRGTVEEPATGEAAPTVTVNGIAATVDAGTFVATGVALVPGTNRLTARAVDAAGNGGVHVRTIVRDEEAPGLRSSEPASGALALPLDTVFRLEWSERMSAPGEGAWTLETDGAEGGSETLGASLDRSTLADGGESWRIVPDADLPPDAAIRLRLDAVVDRAGNPFPATTLEYRTRDPRAPPAPELDPVPGAICASALEITGRTWALAEVTVEGGAASASARADDAGDFAVDVDLRTGATQRLVVTAADLEGDVGPATEIVVVHDCNAPTVADAQLEPAAITVEFSEAIDPATLAGAVVVTDVATEAPLPGAVVAVGPSVARFEPATAFPEGAVRLEVTTDVTDEAGNPLDFPYVRLFSEATAESFFSGIAIDESTGRPLAGVRVHVTATDGVATGAGAPETTSGPRGRFVLPVFAGTHDVTFSRPGRTPVFRIVTTLAGRGTEVFDPRLAEASPAISVGAAGGVVEGAERAGAGVGPGERSAARLDVPAGALDAPADLAVTALPEQALPALLPYGFSPRGAVWVRVDGPDGAVVLSQPATLTVPVDAPDGSVLPVVALDLGTLQWRMVAEEAVVDGVVTTTVIGTGAVAVVEADTGETAPPTPIPGEVLGSGPLPQGGEVLAAALSFDPAVVLPTGTSRAEATYTLDPALLATAASGLPLVVRVEEELELADGTVRRDAPFRTDLVVYRSSDGTPRSRFRLRPSAAAATLPVRLGVETVEIYPYRDESVRGNVLGPDGGEIVGDDGDRLEVPPGALAEPTAVVVERGSADDLPIGAPADTALLGVVRLDTSGARLAVPGQLHLADSLVGPPDAGERGLVLHLRDVDGSWRWRVVAEARPSGAGWRSHPFDVADLPWPGVRDEGWYAFVGLPWSPGFLRGTVTAPGGGPAGDARVEARPDGGTTFGWLQLADEAGRYALPVQPGTLVADARSAAGGEAVSVAATVDAADDRVDLDLPLAVVPPWVAEVSPADGAVGVPVGVEPWVRFSEPVEAASLEGELELRLDGLAVPAAIELDGATARLVPDSPLVPETAYELWVGPGIRDLDGNPLASAFVGAWTTGSVELPDEVHRDRIHLIAPDHTGEARVLGLPGAVPGEATVFVENLTSLAATETASSGQDGSFELRIAASLDDRLLLHLLVEGGNEIVVLLGPWRSLDLDATRVGPDGGEWTTGDGLDVFVEAGTFDGPTWVRASVGAALPVPEGVTRPLRFDLDLGGAVAAKPIGLRLPLPTGEDSGGPWMLARRVSALGETGWMLEDVLEVDGDAPGMLTNGRFPGGGAGVTAPVERSGAGGRAGRVAGGAGQTTVLAPPRRWTAPRKGPVEGLVQVPRRGGDADTRSSASRATSASASAPLSARATVEPRLLLGVQQYLRGPLVGGTYQAAQGPPDTSFGLVPMPLRGATGFYQRTWDGWQAIYPQGGQITLPWAVLPVRRTADFEIEARDLTTGYSLWRQAFPAPEGPGATEVPGTVWATLPPPVPVGGDPLRFHLVGAVPGPDLELEPKVRRRLEDGDLIFTGAPGAVPADVSVHAIGLDDALEARVNADAAGAFELRLGDATAGHRYLLGLGAVVDSVTKLEIELSNASAEELAGFEVLRQDGNFLVSASSRVEQVGHLQRVRVAPVGGWHDGRHVLRIGPGLTDGQLGDDGEPRSWGRTIDVEFEVEGTTVHPTYTDIGPTRDLLRMGSLLFSAAEQQGVRVLDVGDPGAPANYFAGSLGVPLPLQDPVRGLAADDHGRVVAVGGGVAGLGQLRFLDPTKLVRGASSEADRTTAWQGQIQVTRNLSELDGFLVAGTPRRVALLNGDTRDRWTFDPEFPPEDVPFTVTSTPTAEDDTWLVVVEGTDGADGQPVTLRNQTRGRWSRDDAADGTSYRVEAEVHRGDRLELLRSAGAVAYVTIDGRGLAAVDLEEVWQGEISVEEIASGHQRLHRGFEVPDCPGAGNAFNPVDVGVLAPSRPGQPWTVPTLIFGYGLVLLEVDPADPEQLSVLTTACGGISGTYQMAGMALMPQVRVDLDGDGPRQAEIRDLIAVTNRSGWVLVYDVTERGFADEAGNTRPPAEIARIATPGPAGALRASEDGRLLYVSGYGGGVYVVELRVIAADAEPDADGNGRDDRVLESIPVEDESLSTPVFVDADLGIGWVGGLEQGVTPLTLGAPRLSFVAGTQDVIRVDRLAPFGVPTLQAGGAELPGLVRLEARLPVAAADEETGGIRLDLRAVGPSGLEIAGAGDHADLPPTSYADDAAVVLIRQAAHAWEEGSMLYLSEPIVTLADLRASMAYPLGEEELPECERCDLVEQDVYPDPEPLEPYREILSGHALEARLVESTREALRELYGAERLAEAVGRASSTPWDVTPSPRQEPTLNPSMGAGDVAPGTLLHSGEMTLTETDIAIRGRRLGFAFTRTYRNQTLGTGPLGPGWDHVYRQRLRELPNGDVDYYDGRGRRETFERSATTGTYTSPKGRFSELERAPEGWTLVDPQRNTARFDRWGRLVTLADALHTAEDRGNRMTFAYDGRSRLAEVRDDLDRRITFRYEDDRDRLTEIEDFDGRAWTFAYDADGRLETVSTPEVEVYEAGDQPLVTTYAYGAAAGSLDDHLWSRDDLVSVTDPKGQTWLDLTYADIDGDGHAQEVTRQQWGDGEVFVAYDFDTGVADVTDRRGHHRIHTHDEGGRRIQLRDPTHATWTWTYDDEGLLTEQREPLGRRTTLAYDADGDRRSRGNVVESRVHADSRGSFTSSPVLTTTYEHHAETNQPTLITSPLGRVTRIHRRDDGVVERLVRAEGADEEAETTFEVNAFGQSTRVVDPNGHATAYAYFDAGESAGYLRRVTTDPGGLAITTRYETDARGNVTAMVDPRGVRHERDVNALDWTTVERSAVTGSTDGAPPLNLTTTTHYDRNGNVARVEVPFGDGSATTATLYRHGVLDELRELEREIEPGGATVLTALDYDAHLNPIRTTDPEGNVREVDFDSRDLPTTIRSGLGTDPLATPIVEVLAYDLDRQFQTRTDGRGKVWRRSYDGFGRLRETLDPLGNRSVQELDDHGRVVQATSFDTAGMLLAQSGAGYDLLDRPTSATRHLWEPPADPLEAGPDLPEDAREVTTRFEYDAASNLRRVIDPLERVTERILDAADRVVETVDAAGNREELERDAFGNVVEQRSVETGPDVGTVEVPRTASFDALGRLVETADALGNTTRLQLDARGLARTVIDPEGHFTHREFDGLNRVTQETKPEGIRVDYGWDEASRLRTYTDALGNETSWEYDALSRVREERRPGDLVETYSWNETHDLVEQTDPRGTTVTQDVDDAGRAVARTVTPAEGETLEGPVTETYDWDGLDRMVRAVSGGVSTELVRDSLSRLLSDTTAGRVVSHRLDELGNPTATIYPSDHEVVRTFDVLDRPDTIGSAGAAAPAVDYAYRGRGRVLQKTFGNGLTSGVTFDAVGRQLRELVEAEGQAVPVFEESLGWSPRHLKVSQRRGDLGGAGLDVRYDDAGRVTTASWLPAAAETPPGVQIPSTEAPVGAPEEGAETFDFTYDAAQNLLSRAKREEGVETLAEASPPDPSGWNRPERLGDKALAWDPNGNLIAKGDQRFAYDWRNRLTKVSRVDDEGDVVPVATYAYDAFNRRIRKEVDGAVEETVWDGWQAIEQYADGQLASRQTYGIGIDEVVTKQVDLDGDGIVETAHTPIYDSTGNIALLTGVDGKPVERYRYSPFGERTITADLTPPEVDQIRVTGGAIVLELSEEVSAEALQEAVADGKLRLVDTASADAVEVEVSQPVQVGRMARKRVVVTPAEVPMAGAELELVVEPEALVDLFWNRPDEAATWTWEWPDGDAIVEDVEAPWVDLVIVREGVVEIGWEEAVDLDAAAAAVTIDGVPTTWTLGPEDPYRIVAQTMLADGFHSLEIASGVPLDLAGLGLAAPFAVAVGVDLEGPEQIVHLAPDLNELEDSAVANSYGFHGLPKDKETGLLYVRNRFYEPELGRFVTADPLGFVDGPSQYIFAFSDPLNSGDPLGLKGRAEKLEELLAAMQSRAFRLGRRRLTHYNTGFAGDPVSIATLRQKTRVRKSLLDAVDRQFPGLTVPYNEAGFVEFEEASHVVTRGSTRLRGGFSGDSRKDVEDAWKQYAAERGLTPGQLGALRQDYTMHHDWEDGRMIAVRSDVHDAYKHTGGNALAKAGEAFGLIAAVVAPKLTEARENDASLKDQAFALGEDAVSSTILGTPEAIEETSTWFGQGLWDAVTEWAEGIKSDSRREQEEELEKQGI